MRTICLGFAMVAAAASAARADDRKDVAALVSADVQSTIEDSVHPPPRVDRYFNIATSHATSSQRENMYGHAASKIVQEVKDLVVGFDKEHHAWFHATIEASYDWAPCDETGRRCEPTTKRKKTWRYSGLAIDENGWKLAVTMWSHVISDAELFKRAEPIKPPTILVDKGDPALLVKGWFDGRSIAKDISASAQAIASGTAPGEVGQGNAATKLAKAWDGLKMSAPIISSREFGSVAFVNAWVHLVDKKRAGYDVTMALGTVLVKENGTWRWVMLSFAAPADPWE